MPAVRIENVSKRARLLVLRLRRDTPHAEPDSFGQLFDLDPGEAQIVDMTAGERVTVIELDAATALKCAQQMAAKHEAHNQADTFATQLAQFRECAAAYAFELNQEAIERALREETVCTSAK